MTGMALHSFSTGVESWRDRKANDLSLKAIQDKQRQLATTTTAKNTSTAAQATTSTTPKAN